jgi:hypothetical protein
MPASSSSTAPDQPAIDAGNATDNLETPNSILDKELRRLLE